MSVVGAHRALEQYIGGQAQLGIDAADDLSALMSLMGGRPVPPEARDRALALLRGRGEAALADALESALESGRGLPGSLEKALSGFVEDEMRRLADWSGKVGYMEQVHQSLLLPVKKVMDVNDQAVSAAVRNLLA